MRVERGPSALGLLAEVASTVVPTGGSVRALDPELAAALRARGLEASTGAAGALHDVAVASLPARAEHWEGLVASLAQELRPGGRLVLGTSLTLRAGLLGSGHEAVDAGHEAVDADGMRRLLGHRGLACELVCAPGAADLLAGVVPRRYRPELDRRSGVLDAGDLLVAVGSLHAEGAARSAEFLATLPRKVVAAAVVCRDGGGRLLVVHDSFKQHWTIPGGIVDPDEDPGAAAARETWEEAGVRVVVGPLLGVFAGRRPDRLVLVYEAIPEEGASSQPQAVHAHEIDAVAWVALDQALDRLAPHVRGQVTRCLEQPGKTWPPADRA